MRDFGLMTAQELAEYSGMVYTACCTFRSHQTERTIPVDYECPTPELREAAVKQGRARVGFLVSRTDYQAERRQPGHKWARAFGGINGRCGTNPEDAPDEMMTAAEFWANHANSNSN